MKKHSIIVCVLIAATTAFAASPAYQNALVQAKTFFEAKDYSSTRKSLEVASGFSETPEEKAQVLLQIGRTYDEQNEVAKARESWQQALLVAGITTEQKTLARVNIARGFLIEKRYSDARAQIAQLVADPSTGKVAADSFRVFIAGTYKDEGKPDVAEAEFAKIVDDADTTPALRWTAQTRSGEIAFARKDFSAARARFLKAIELPGLNPAQIGTAQNRVVATYTAQGNTGQADIATAQYQAALLSKGEELYKAGKVTLARDYFTGAVMSAGPLGNPSTVAFYRLQIANTYTTQGNFKRSDQELQDVLKFINNARPTTKHTLILANLQLMEHMVKRALAINLRKQGKETEAREAFQNLLDQPDLRPDLRPRIEQDLRNETVEAKIG